MLKLIKRAFEEQDISRRFNNRMLGLLGYIQKWNDLFHWTDMICFLLSKILQVYM